MLGCVNNGFDGVFNEAVVDGNFETHFGNQVGGDFLTTVEVDVLGAAVAGAAADGDATDVGIDEGLADFVELVGLNDGDDEFHEEVWLGGCVCVRAAGLVWA